MYVSLYAICVWNWNWWFTQDLFLIKHWSQRTHRCSAVRCWPWGIFIGAGQPLQHGEVRDTNLAWVRPVGVATIGARGPGPKHFFTFLELIITVTWQWQSNDMQTLPSRWSTRIFINWRHSSTLLLSNLCREITRYNLSVGLRSISLIPSGTWKFFAWNLFRKFLPLVHVIALVSNNVVINVVFQLAPLPCIIFNINPPYDTMKII